MAASPRQLLLTLLLLHILTHSKTEAQTNGGRVTRYTYTSQDPAVTLVRSPMRAGRGQPISGDHVSYRRFPESRAPGMSQYRNGDGRQYIIETVSSRHGQGGMGRQSPRYHTVIRHNNRGDMSMGGSMPRYSTVGVQNERGMYSDSRYPQNPVSNGMMDRSSMGHYQGGLMNQGLGVMHQPQQQLNPFASAGLQPQLNSASTFSAGSLHQPGLMQTLIHSQPGLQHTLAGATTNILPVVIQQAPQVLPVPFMGVASSPLQSMMANAGTPSLGGGGFGSNLNSINTLNSVFSGMSPVIIRMEDMLHAQPGGMNPFGARSQNPLMGGMGTGLHNPADPNLSVVKLDEGLNIVINYSNPSGTIMNLPVPSNDDEKRALINVLERAEAPEYIKHMVRIRPTPNPAAIAAMAAAKSAAVANAAAVVNAAAAAGAAMAAAATVTNTAALVPAVAPAASVAGTPVVGGVPAPAPAMQVVAPGVGEAAGLPSDFSVYDDVPIDEIIAGAFVGMATGATGSVMTGANYPTDHSVANGKFMLTSLDMELTPSQYAELQSPVGVGRYKRKALTNTRSRWTNGIVPYEITGNVFTPTEQQLIQEAMNKWSATTCIRFRPATAADPNKLVFREGKGCSSNVGMIGGPQFLTLQKECRIPKILAHEIGHALGLIHEHQRQDRDSYLKINYHNIKPGTNKDFDIFKLGSVEHSYANYDYMSIMHYGKTAFARDKNLLTMEAVDTRYTNLMGRATNLSPSDWGTVNSMYGCDGLSGMAGASMMSGSPVGAAAAIAPVQTMMASPAVFGAPASQVFPAVAPAAGAVVAPMAPMAPMAPASPPVSVIPAAPASGVVGMGVGGASMVVPAAPGAGVQTFMAPAPAQLAAAVGPAPAAQINPVLPATGGNPRRVVTNDNNINNNNNGGVLVTSPRVGAVVSGVSVTSPGVVSTVDGGSGAVVGGVGVGSSGRSGGGNAAGQTPSIMISSKKTEVVVGGANVRAVGGDGRAVGGANGDGKIIVTKESFLNEQTSTDLCAGFTKYCHVDHDLVFSVLGPQILAKCGHLCLKTQPIG